MITGFNHLNSDQIGFRF